MQHTFFAHTVQDFAINVTTDGSYYTVEMTLGNDTISCGGIKFVMDEDLFETFDYTDWVNYFNVMKEEEWAEDVVDNT